MTGYISKNKADWLFQEIFCDEEYCGGSCYKCGKEAQYRNKLLQEPKADVQPVKHGRWIEQKHTPTNGYNYNVPYSTYICSSCGLEIHNDEYSKYVRGIYTNCPVCTARMDGDTND